MTTKTTTTKRKRKAVDEALVEAAARRFLAQQPRNDTPRTEDEIVDRYDLLSITEFCARHRISPELYFKLQKQGQGPKVIRIGRRVLIPREAAQKWRDKLAAVAQ